MGGHRVKPRQIIYALSGHNLNIAIIFSSLQFFNIICMPLVFVPFVLSAISDAIVVFSHIGAFPTAEELPDLYTIDLERKNTVDVDASFAWETEVEIGEPKFAPGAGGGRGHGGQLLTCAPPSFFFAPPPPLLPLPPAPTAATPSNAPLPTRTASPSPLVPPPRMTPPSSFSSGSSDCPLGVAQDPSVTTDTPSTAGADPTTPVSDPESDPVSTPAASDPVSDPASDPISAPAVSTPAVFTPSVSTPAVSMPAVSTPAKSSARTGAPANPTDPSPSPSPSQTGGRAL
ncbi:hypothetical protein DFH08DRAFT_1053119 [Mycena albidolilacea]|uniref:Uncharacterized protein n=1 Tax=Mycena albidolilacea TaxID=1033008 RepID=A0AAD7ADL1_9AGAR|nr:hypothetical protein DFH08DRAFT_1053119 [Mycena albidolilacea]